MDKMRLKKTVLIRTKIPVFGMIKQLRKLKETHLALRMLKEIFAEQH